MTTDQQSARENRLTLELLIKRLEPRVANKPRRHAAWIDGSEAAALTQILTPDGHLVQALAIARAALASDDEHKIAAAARRCQWFERTGDRVALTADARRSEAIRRKGGQKRGEVVSEAAAEKMKPYVEMYRTKLAAGVGYLAARRMVSARMVKDEQGEPSRPTILKWFPKIM